MKNMFRSTTTLVLIIVFLVACFIGTVIVFGLGWLHTYKVFTQETPVAKVTISEEKEDELGTYADVTVELVKGRSPLAAIVNPSDDSDDNIGTVETFKIYGDYVEIGGPVVKFENFLTLLNLKTVYKVALLNGAYVTDTDLERNRSDEMFSRFELNGGFSSWKSVQEDVQSGNLRGKIMDIFIDSIPQIDPKGVFITQREQDLVLCVTEEGFRFCDKEIE